MSESHTWSLEDMGNIHNISQCILTNTNAINPTFMEAIMSNFAQTVLGLWIQVYGHWRLQFVVLLNCVVL